MSSVAFDIVVAGGGISGLLVARELRAAGLAVCIVERGEVGAEASWAGGGILSPLYPWRYDAAVTALARWGQARYAALCREWQEQSGVDPEYQASGLLMLDEDEVTPALVWAPAAGAEVDGLDRPELAALAPEVQPPGRSAAWMPAVGQVRNPRLVRALEGAVEAMGVVVRTGEAVEGLLGSRGRVDGVVTAAGRIRAGAVVVTTGAWASRLLEPFLTVAIKPVRGQMLLYRAASDTVGPMVLAGGRYVIPRRDGRVLVGSTLEDAGFDKRTTAAARADLEAAARAIVPALGDHPVEHHWAGLRPGSPDGVPYIGPVPGTEGLYVNAGHYRNGIVLGPAAARLLADLVLGHAPIVDPAPYAVDRPRRGAFGL
ncbi:MAG: glycine oxidase ThiO [Gammaproteobacteria bacterium]|nr:glycine oxidase ThiO [Gammaproteobacteria bacterium]